MMAVLQTKMCFECPGREEAMQDMTVQLEKQVGFQGAVLGQEKNKPIVF